MIICFSGTGNSRKVADMLQDAYGDELVRLAPGLMTNTKKVKLTVYDGRIIWVFPVHGWGLPNITANVLRDASIQSRGDVVHHMVCTCGDDVGLTDKQWRKLVKSRGWHDGSAYSVQMPNTYVFFPGFDVDKPEVVQAKLHNLPLRIDEIVKSLNTGCYVTDVVRGSWPWVKSKIVYPWFRRFMYSTKPFHATDACTNCGKCARNCPLTNIVMINRRPAWGDVCCMCSRCYNSCPHQAVQYGRVTRGKGQYMCPGYTLK